MLCSFPLFFSGADDLSPPSQSWSLKVIETAPVEAGGYRTVIAEVNGDKVYSKLKYEAGVHRVQVRLPFLPYAKAVCCCWCDNPGGDAPRPRARLALLLENTARDLTRVFRPARQTREMLNRLMFPSLFFHGTKKRNTSTLHVLNWSWP